MRKNGFTLIELIAVIAILIIVIAIVGPELINVLQDNKEKALEKQKEIIITAARSYVIDYKVNIPATITIEELCDTEYLTCPIENAVTGENITGSVNVDINRDYTITLD